MIYSKNIIEILQETITESLIVCNNNNLSEKDKITIIMYLFQRYNSEYRQFIDTLNELHATFSNFYHEDTDINNKLFYNIRDMRSVYQYRYDLIVKIEDTINRINNDSKNTEKLPTIRQITNIFLTPYVENTTFPSYNLYMKDMELGILPIPTYKEYLDKWKLIQGKHKGSINVIVSCLKRYTSLVNSSFEKSDIKTILKDIKSNKYKDREVNIDIEKVVSHWKKVTADCNHV